MEIIFWEQIVGNTLVDHSFVKGFWSWGQLNTLNSEIA